MTVKYTKDHEWIAVDGKTGRVGITDYAQLQLGDVVFVELPPVGKALKKGGEAAVVESVKAASEVYSPVTGTVTAANDPLADEPALANSDPQGEGWFFEVELADPAELDGLLDEAAYRDYVASLG
ncbi:glycine cleavage system protein GcvH [Zavarzinia compransoris]|uniref:Glycine cleavage system H protein n=1 Tax=Zavarzinia compransoris TaxID=1264899 RepID=A0A317EDM4_9PROT|nr:glycine cleavage system protein GcvH [Zavarzinia compransoris]PWR23315.1 glycine cleavage system protein GcvH [Zavarzinia compransoris]TDP46113.1 glycine cleavage system H protein [Zavarzinia compransoris]